MEIKKLVDTINRTYISSDYLRQPDIYYYMDRVIDDINENLQASFPTFSEWGDFVEEYNKQFNPVDVEPEPTPDDPKDKIWVPIVQRAFSIVLSGQPDHAIFSLETRVGDPVSVKFRPLEVRLKISFEHFQDVTLNTGTYNYNTTYCAPVSGSGYHRYFSEQVLSYGQILIEQPDRAAKTVSISSYIQDTALSINDMIGGNVTLPEIPVPMPPQPVPKPIPRPMPRPKRRHKFVPPVLPTVYEHQKLWADYGPKDRTVYDAIPDKYLRSVVALGAALYYYEADEEGEQIAMDYQQRYLQQLFYMVRDYQMLVPPMYQNNFGGYIDFSHNREFGPHDLHPRGVVMRGYNSRIL